MSVTLITRKNGVDKVVATGVPRKAKMSEPKGLFDAVIWILEKQIAIETSMGGGNLAEQLHGAVKFIEVAGKVARDKQRCLEYLDGETEDEELRDEEGCKIFPRYTIRTLFEALPEEGKK